MAVLSDSERLASWREIMNTLSQSRLSCSLTKDQLWAAVDAADNWINSNAASYNSALPAVARTGLSAKQKALILAVVIMRRYGAT